MSTSCCKLAVGSSLGSFSADVDELVQRLGAIQRYNGADTYIPTVDGQPNSVYDAGANLDTG